MHPDLNAAAIAAHRRRADDGIRIEVVDETGSTNADLLARIGANAGIGSASGLGAKSSSGPVSSSVSGSVSGSVSSSASSASSSPGDAARGRLQPTLLAARRQTAGRGRAGRSWHSDAGSLTFSLSWQFGRPLSGLVGLPLAVGVTLAEVLRARGADVSLKWPNDLLQDGAKLAGILIETAGAPTGVWAVIGIGINLAADAPAGAGSDPGRDACTGIGVDIDPGPNAPTRSSIIHPACAGDIANLGAPSANLAAPIARLAATDRNRLLAELLDALAACLQEFDRSGFSPWAARWNALHAHRDREVRIIDRDRELHAGRALGVDGHGRLLLQTPAGDVAVMAGDVSLRPAVAENG